MKTFREYLTEITRPETTSQASRVLAKGGWQKGNSGAFGGVWTHPKKDYVLKLFNNEDESYKRYLDLITSKDNPHFPVLRGKPMKVNDNYSAVRMEKLSPRPPQSTELTQAARRRAEYEADNQHDSTTSAADRYLNTIRSLTRAQQSKLLKIGEPQLGYDSGIHKLEARASAYENQNPHMARALSDIHRHVLEPTDSVNDLANPNNVMWRGNTPVITDPVAFGHPSNAGKIPYDKQKQLDLFKKLPVSSRYAIREPEPEIRNMSGPSFGLSALGKASRLFRTGKRAF